MGIFDIFKKKPTKEAKSIKVVLPESKKIPARRPTPKRKDVREVYKILKEPHISEKATQLSDEGKYVFKVYPQANKIQIKKAISGLYGVEVKEVNIIKIKPKKRTLQGIKGTKAGYKKAIVTLEKGEKIEILPH